MTATNPIKGHTNSRAFFIGGGPLLGSALLCLTALAPARPAAASRAHTRNPVEHAAGDLRGVGIELEEMPAALDRAMLGAVIEGGAQRRAAGDEPVARAADDERRD